MRLAGLALVVLLGGCAHSTAWRVVGADDPGWQARAAVVTQAVKETARPAYWGGIIEALPACEAACGTAPGWRCAGCNPTGRHVVVRWTPDPLAGALAHELCHLAFCRPHGDCGEPVADACASVAVQLARERLGEAAGNAETP
ncbi:MAG: hypothetical protein IPQ24_07955 [Anaeromyxobacter sp.]|nr:hypothetical protein [Anaeromyxobacter sp.]